MGRVGTVPAVEVTAIVRFMPDTKWIQSKPFKPVITNRSIATQCSTFVSWPVPVVSFAWEFTHLLTSPKEPAASAAHLVCDTCLPQ